ncbi:winged helix-turn-helix transcriptional regulator [Rhizobium pusense]|nr:winged helix-turn-helix transcriptional regulator [Agrobacterium pusense]
MDEARAQMLYELADLVHGISRQLPAPRSLEPGICTPIEIQVMRCIAKAPGSAANVISRASRLPSSNFARVLRGLEMKGLVRRKAGKPDGRVVNLYLTDLAIQNFSLMRDAWSEALDGIFEHPSEIESVNVILRRIEQALLNP